MVMWPMGRTEDKSKSININIKAACRNHQFRTPIRLQVLSVFTGRSIGDPTQAPSHSVTVCVNMKHL